MKHQQVLLEHRATMGGNRTTFQRQQEILDLLFRNEQGLTRTAIASVLGVDKTVITRDCQRMLDQGLIREGEKRQLFLVQERYRFDIRLSVDEMQALAMACRSLAVNLRWNLPHASSALRKLALCQAKSFPVLSAQIQSTARLMDQLPVGTRLATSVSQLSEAIERQRYVIVRYTSPSKPEQEFRVLPGRLEPYASGHSIYLYGLDTTTNKLRVLKVNRIRSLGLTTTKASSEDIQLVESLLRPERFYHSWGIWVSDKEPQKVTLHFSAEVASRVNETLWHPTQEVEEYVADDGTKDGSILWSAWITETKEMVPWIRGWGEDCKPIAWH